MKIVCEKCSAKYSIADEKVKGKVFKIHCKKCGETIVVRGDAQQGDGAAHADEGNEAETKVFDYSGYQGGDDQAVWHIVVEGQQQGPYTAGQLREYIDAGSLDFETLVWREGMGDWLPIKGVPELVRIMGGKSPAKAAPAPAGDAGGLFDAPAPASGGGLFDAPAAAAPGGGGGLFDAPAGGGLFSGGGGGLFDAAPAAPSKKDSPFAAAGGDGLFSAAAAAPKKGGGDIFSSTAGSTGGGMFGKAGAPAAAPSKRGPDLFGGGSDDDLEPMGGAFASPAAQAGGPRVSAQQAMTGQRNENSVLFSLSNLQALASAAAPVAAAAGPGKKDDASGLIDIRTLSNALGSDGKGSAVDDLISIGGAGFAPSLGAPVLSANKRGLSTGALIGIIGGSVVVLAAIVVALVIFLSPKDEPKQDPMVAQLMEELKALKASGGSAADIAAAEKKMAEAAAAAGGSVQPVQPEPPASTDVAKKDDGKKDDRRDGRRDDGKKTDDTKKGTDGATTKPTATQPADTAKPAGGKGKVDELDDLLGGGGKKPAPAPTAAPKPAGGGAAPAPAAGGLPEGPSRSDIQSGMNGVADAVRRCGQGQTGTVVVSVTIANTGRVTAAEPTGSFAGTPVGLCAARAVRAARFNKFQKSEQVVKYPFKL